MQMHSIRDALEHFGYWKSRTVLTKLSAGGAAAADDDIDALIAEIESDAPMKTKAKGAKG